MKDKMPKITCAMTICCFFLLRGPGGRLRSSPKFVLIRTPLNKEGTGREKGPFFVSKAGFCLRGWFRGVSKKSSAPWSFTLSPYREEKS